MSEQQPNITGNMNGNLDRGGGGSKRVVDLSAWSVESVLSKGDRERSSGIDFNNPLKSEFKTPKEMPTPGVGDLLKPKGSGIRTRKVKDLTNYERANQKRGNGTSSAALRVREIRDKMKMRIEELRALVAPEDTGRLLRQSDIMDRAVEMLMGVDSDTWMRADELQASEAERGESWEELELPTLEGLQDLLVVTDVTGGIVYATESGNYSLGFPPEELLMGNIVDLVHWSEATSVQMALTQGLSFRSYHFLVHSVTFDNQRLMVFSGRYSGPTNNMGLKLLAMGSGTPARYYKAWSLNHVAISAVVVWSGNAMDTVCGYPAMYMTTVMPFVFVHPDDIAALVAIHRAAVVDGKVGVMNNRLFSRHGSWVMTENTIYPCINRKTGKVEYTVTEGVHTDNMNTEPMESLTNENRALPYQAIYYDDMEELVQRCTELSLQGRREFEQLTRQAEEIETTHIMMEHSRLRTVHYPDRVRASNEWRPTRAVPWSDQSDLNQRSMQSTQVAVQPLVKSRIGSVGDVMSVNSRPIDLHSGNYVHPLGTTSKSGYSSSNPIGAHAQPQSVDNRKDLPKEILPHNESTYGQAPDLFSVLRSIAVPEGDIYSIVMGLDALAQERDTFQPLSSGMDRSSNGLSSDSSTPGGSSTIFNSSSPNTFRYRHQDFIPRPANGNQALQPMFPEANKMFSTNFPSEIADDKTGILGSGTAATVQSGHMQNTQNNRNFVPRIPSTVSTSDTDTASLSTLGTVGSKPLNFSNGIPPLGNLSVGNTGLSAEADLDIAIMAELMASGGITGANFGVLDAGGSNFGHNEPMQNTSSNSSIGSKPSMATHGSTASDGSRINSPNRLFGQEAANSTGRQDPDVEYLLEIMKQGVDRAPDQSHALLNSLSGSSAARQHQMPPQQGNQ